MRDVYVGTMYCCSLAFQYYCSLISRVDILRVHVLQSNIQRTSVAQHSPEQHRLYADDGETMTTMGREQHVEAAKRQMRSCGRSMCPYRSIVCVFLSYCAVMCWWYVRELGNAQDTFRIAFESTIFPMVANSDYQVNAYGTQRTPPPPRIVQFDFVRNEKQQLGSLEVIRRGRTVEFQKLTWQRDVKQASLPRSKGVCVPMKWQRRRFLSCNNVHELETDLEFINCGGSRCAFKFLDIDGRAQVLKTKK